MHISAYYSTYAGVTAGLSGIRSTIVDGSMPQKTTFSDSRKNSVVCWIDNGAQNN